MKTEPYFTEDNIHQSSARMMGALNRIRRPGRVKFQAKSAGLLVIDMQRYFLSPKSHAYVPSARAIVKNVKNLIRIFSEKSLPVILTRHINNKNNAGMMMSWWNDLITEAEPSSEIVPELIHPGSRVIKKSQYDAFFKTHLEELLKEKGISHLVITGVMTHLCCDTTARSAFMRGFSVFFAVDGTATQNYELHIASLISLTHGFVVPVLCREIYEKVSKI